jgi:hypothetical protein
MSALMDVTIFNADKISAKSSNGTSSVWLDLTLKDRAVRACTLTLFFEGVNRGKAATYAAVLNSVNAKQEAA